MQKQGKQKFLFSYVKSLFLLIVSLLRAIEGAEAEQVNVNTPVDPDGEVPPVIQRGAVLSNTNSAFFYYSFTNTL